MKPRLPSSVCSNCVRNTCIQLTSVLPWRTGALFIRASQEWLEQFENVRFEGLQGANAQKTLLVVAVMSAHALGEGSGVGVSFCGHRGWVQVPYACISALTLMVAAVV